MAEAGSNLCLRLRWSALARGPEITPGGSSTVVVKQPLQDPGPALTTHLVTAILTTLSGRTEMDDMGPDPAGGPQRAPGTSISGLPASSYASLANFGVTAAEAEHDASVAPWLDSGQSWSSWDPEKTRPRRPLAARRGDPAPDREYDCDRVGPSRGPLKRGRRDGAALDEVLSRARLRGPLADLPFAKTPKTPNQDLSAQLMSNPAQCWRFRVEPCPQWAGSESNLAGPKPTSLESKPSPVNPSQLGCYSRQRSSRPGRPGSNPGQALSTPHRVWSNPTRSGPNSAQSKSKLARKWYHTAAVPVLRCSVVVQCTSSTMLVLHSAV